MPLYDNDLDTAFYVATTGQEPDLFRESRVKRIVTKIQYACQEFVDSADARRMFYSVTAPDVKGADVPFYIRLDVSVKKPFASFMPPPFHFKPTGPGAHLQFTFHRPSADDLMMCVREYSKASGSRERQVMVENINSLERQILGEVKYFLSSSFSDDRNKGGEDRRGQGKAASPEISRDPKL